MLWHLEEFSKLRLDIVGLIAVLGEGSVTRNAQVASLSWWSVIPRLLPAPQALLEHERKKRLPTEPGIVVGAYSGSVRKELNFFTILLHGSPPPDYVVELVMVERKAVVSDTERPPKSFSAVKWGTLFWLSIVGFAMLVALLVLASVYDDAFGLMAVMTLSAVSSIVGFSSHWALSFKEPPKTNFEGRQSALPRSDVVIYYPNGAMRIIRTKEEGISRLYFQAEHCEYFINDTIYRALALAATVLLMAGVISLANATSRVQAAFAASYVLLNVLYWAVSALNPRQHHWKTKYNTDTRSFKLIKGGAIFKPPDRSDTIQSSSYHKKQRMKKLVQEKFESFDKNPKLHQSSSHEAVEHPRNFTAALWIAIFLTGTSQWLNEATHIAPINRPWREWLDKAEEQAQLSGEEAEAAARKGATFLDVHQIVPTKPISTGLDKEKPVVNSQEGRMLIPDWDYQKELTRCLQKYAPQLKKQLPSDLPGPPIAV